MAKSEERQLRDLLETTQAEVKRLKAELAEREKAGPVEAPPRVDAKEVQALREEVRVLQQENTALRLTRTENEAQLTALRTELDKTRRETTRVREEAAQAHNEIEQLEKRLEATSQALAKSRAKVQRLSSTPANKRSLLERIRGLFGGGGGGGKAEELELAQKEIARLNQQLSLARFNRRKGR
ncbi:hypothetical protein [Vitiosangium sp. GDMCC 1.1324]|uniref:hypothetical protein n=1 Tax=Vitiosangium sp. (strain GDMCC 1.1324) TaxID=2138576 RepID=UPI0011B3D37E|nr:hypothetical protein [Vitiosangium sp. GDMCC 1.1324]